MKKIKRLGDLPIGTKIEIDGETWEIAGFTEERGVMLERINQYDSSHLHKWITENFILPKAEKEIIPMGFLLSRHELEMGGCPYKYTPWPIEQTKALKADWMEGPSWFGKARDKFGARIVGKMVLGKAYLYQMYTTCFLEFNSFDKAKECYDWGEANVDCFGYDPVAIIDTSNPDHVQRWKNFLEEDHS